MAKPNSYGRPQYYLSSAFGPRLARVPGCSCVVGSPHRGQTVDNDPHPRRNHSVCRLWQSRLTWLPIRVLVATAERAWRQKQSAVGGWNHSRMWWLIRYSAPVVAVGCELSMIELRKEVSSPYMQGGRRPRHLRDFEKEQPGTSRIGCECVACCRGARYRRVNTIRG